MVVVVVQYSSAGVYVVTLCYSEHVEPAWSDDVSARISQAVIFVFQ